MQVSFPLKIFSVVLFDACCILFAYWFSIDLVNSTQATLFHKSALLFVAIQVFAQIPFFFYFGLYRGIWRFFGVRDLLKIIYAIALTSIIGVTTALALKFSVALVINANMLSMILVSAGRIMYRLYREKNFLTESHHSVKNILIIGSGNEAEKLCREILNANSQTSGNINTLERFKIIGFLDESPSKKNLTIHGVPILGSIDNLENIILRNQVDKIFIALFNANNGPIIRTIVEKCKNNPRGNVIEIKTLPLIQDFIYNKVTSDKLRKVEPEDLLGRSVIALDQKPIEEMIKNKIVMVTGAGGSIGSELCLEILKLKPKIIVLFEICEFFLYEVESLLSEKLAKYQNDTKIVSVIGDVRDEKKVEDSLKFYRPHVVFHVAAYKHVPMSERNPIETIMTNVKGTKNTAELSIKYDVEKFVLVSTDKAVNPTNIMGTTKRIAEMICQYLEKKNQYKTKFSIVRFGNVLGSSGSVIPKFKKQIEEGGPITVTHPEVERFFMSKVEAAQLILQSASYGMGGEVFVLEMGRSIKIADLAKEMIIFYGLTLDKDIKIEYSGLREGEKLYEETFNDLEETIPTQHKSIFKVRPRKIPDKFWVNLQKILSLKHDESLNTIRYFLQVVVPEYNPPNMIFERAKNLSLVDGVNHNEGPHLNN